MMTPAERAEAFERTLSPALAVLADPDSDPQAFAYARGVLSRVTELIDDIRALRGGGKAATRSPQKPRPHDAREAAENDEREAAGLRRLRKGRDQCAARRRDGQPCQAPAIEGGLVCRRHGGAAPQVAIAAEYRQKQLAAYEASAAFERAKGTPGEFDALCRALRRQEELDEYEKKLALLRELQAKAKRARASQPPAAEG
jgi:hypothetical protein